MEMSSHPEVSRRKHPRHDIAGSITVIDRRTGSSIGTIANISLEGMMIIGPKALETDSIYQLALKFCRPVREMSSVNLGVDCMWNNTSPPNTGLHWSGCQIIDLSDECIQVLELIIEEYKK